MSLRDAERRLDALEALLVPRRKGVPIGKRLAFVIRLPADLVQRLDARATADHRSRNDLITAILEEGTPK